MDSAVTHHQSSISKSAPVQAKSLNPLGVVLFGAGSRANIYSESFAKSGLVRIIAVCEPREQVRRRFARRFVHRWTDEQKVQTEWLSWQDWVANELALRASGTSSGVDIVIVALLDNAHVAACEALASLGGIHVLCEKPLATTLRDCVRIWAAFEQSWRRTDSNNQDGGGVSGQRQTIFAIGHVLRYTPHNMLLRRLLRVDNVIGDVLSVEHTEPIGWWHYTHSYVRGNWRREDTAAPSLLTKSCHDVDFLFWMLCSPVSASASAQSKTPTHPPPPPSLPLPPHLPSTVTSTGSIRYYRRARKPIAAGTATNCLLCAIEPSCKSSAVNVYWRNGIVARNNYKWPFNVVLPDMEDVLSRSMEHAEGQDKGHVKAALMKALAEDYTVGKTPDEVIRSRTWYGRCVWESDNDVCDDQTVVINWDDDPLPPSSSSNNSNNNTATELGNLQSRGAKTAIFHMVAATSSMCERRGRIYGTHGEITYDTSGNTISVCDFRTNQTTVHTVTDANNNNNNNNNNTAAVGQGGHGGGDDGFSNNMLRAVLAVRDGVMSAQEAQWMYLGADLEECVRSHAAVFAAEEARRNGTVVQWKEWWEREVNGLMREFGINDD